MIELAKKHHTEGIITLWQEAFGDSRSDIEAVLEDIFEYVTVFYEEGIVKGMLSLLPIECDGKTGRYVYAVATLKGCRGQGISTRLLEYAKGLGCDFLVLVPQSDSLFDFYAKRGFFELSCVEKCTATAKKAENFEFLPISAEEYVQKRRVLVSGKSLVEWSGKMIEAARRMYHGELLKIVENGEDRGVALCFKAQDCLYIKEILIKDREEAAAALLAYEREAALVSYVKMSKNQRSAMVYHGPTGEMYFNIALD